MPAEHCGMRRMGWTLLALVSVGALLMAISCLEPSAAVHVGSGKPGSRPGGGPRGAEPAVGAVGWRRDGTGIFPEADPVTEWSPEKNVLWRVKVGSSFSSPIVAGDKVLVTCEPDELVCVSALDGEELWRRPNGADELPPGVLPKGGLPKRNTDCGNTAPTPSGSTTSDGSGSVYVSFNSGIVAAYDLDGERKWIRFFDLDPATAHGRSASPVLVPDDGMGGKNGKNGLLLVHISHLIALDPETGKVTWEAEKARASYGTPAVAEIGGQKVVVTPKGDIVRLSDGSLIAAEVASLSYGTPLVRGDVVYFIDQSSVAAKLPAKMADQIEAEEVWYTDLDGEFFASPVYHDGLIYTVSNEPNYYVLDAATGEIVLQKVPLELPPAGDNRNASVFVYPNVVLAGESLFLFNTDGDAFVLEPSRDYREISRSKLPSGAPGTPTFSGERMFARVGDELYCVGRR